MRNRDAFVQGLREHGYEDGKNVDIVYRWADGDISRFPELATELVALDPAVVVSAANTGTIALRQATSTRIHLTRHTAIDGQHMTTRRRQQPLNTEPPRHHGSPQR
jgi:ABC-type uncharacterized transport system substrate-binding protein